MTIQPNGLPFTNVDVPMPPVKSPRAPDTITIPTTPPRALLVSMAMRLRHDFGIARPVQPDGSDTLIAGGMTPREREVMLTEMAQLYEEVAGKGFYRWDEGPEQRGGLYAL